MPWTTPGWYPSRSALPPPARRWPSSAEAPAVSVAPTTWPLWVTGSRCTRSGSSWAVCCATASPATASPVRSWTPRSNPFCLLVLRYIPASPWAGISGWRSWSRSMTASTSPSALIRIKRPASPARTVRMSSPPWRCCVPSATTRCRISPASRWWSSAAATWPWTSPAAPSDWGPTRSPASIAAVRRT